jgi:hypothetical protein
VAGRCPSGPLTCLVAARDRVEVGPPPVRGEGRLVDRGIKVVVAVKISNGKIATFVFTNSIKESLRLADPLRDSPSPASAGTAATAPGSAARTHPVAARTHLGGPKLATARLHPVRRTSDHTGLPATRVTASVPGDALGMLGRPVSTGLRDSCRLSSFLTRCTAGG